MLDPKIERIIKRYAEQIRTKFEIHELILFGSYARGTATAESDVDLAVVFKKEIQARSEVLIVLCDLAYEILLETDIDISPFPVSTAELLTPDSYSNPDLIKNILHEGIRFK